MWTDHDYSEENAEHNEDSSPNKSTDDPVRQVVRLRICGRSTHFML